MAKSFNQARFVCAVVFVFTSALECLLQNFDTKYLRRLCENQMFSRQCRFDEFFPSPLDGIDDRNGQNCSAAVLRLPHNILDVFHRDEWPHTIVNRDDFRSRFKMLEAHRNRVLPAFPAFDYGDGLLEPGRLHKAAHFVSRMPCRRDDDVINSAALIKLANRVKDDRRAVQNQKLLRAIGFHAPSEPGGSDNCPNFHDEERSQKPEARSQNRETPIPASGFWLLASFLIMLLPSETLPSVPAARGRAHDPVAAPGLAVHRAARGGQFRRVFPRTCRRSFYRLSFATRW